MTIKSEGVLIIEMAALLIWGIVMLVKKTKISKIFFNLAFGLYISLIVAYCLFPIRFGYMQISVDNNFVPFKTISNSIRAYTRDGIFQQLKVEILNLLLMTPLGFFLNQKKLPLRFLTVFLSSAGIELAQFLIGCAIGYNYRSVDIDDIILNTIGGILSCAVFSALPVNKPKYTVDEKSEDTP